MPKLNEYVKVVESTEILGVYLWTVRTWATDARSYNGIATSSSGIDAVTSREASLIQRKLFDN